jgi:hypothetical protein
VSLNPTYSYNPLSMMTFKLVTLLCWTRLRRVPVERMFTLTAARLRIIKFRYYSIDGKVFILTNLCFEPCELLSGFARLLSPQGGEVQNTS